MAYLRQLASAGATVLVLVHKSDKSASAYRGSSEIKAGCDVMWSIKKQPDNKTVELTAEKNRFAKESSFAVRLEPGGFVLCDTRVRNEHAIATEIVTRIVRENPGLNQSKIVVLAKKAGATKQQTLDALEGGVTAMSLET